jgi:hypothetical protein
MKRSSLLLVLLFELAATPAGATEWVVEPSYEVARSPHPFRGGGVAESRVHLVRVLVLVLVLVLGRSLTEAPIRSGSDPLTRLAGLRT